MTGEEKRLVQSLREYAEWAKSNECLALSADLLNVAELMEYLSAKVACTYALTGFYKAMAHDLSKKKEQIEYLEKIIKDKDKLLREIEEDARAWRVRALEREIY